MGDNDNKLMAIPISLIVMAVMDYVAWVIFVAVAGIFAILYMIVLVIAEGYAFFKWVASDDSS